MTADLFQKMIEAKTAWEADDMNLSKLSALEEAEVAFFAALKIAREKYEALPEGWAKDSAEQNAFDTEDTNVDELRWFEIALATYEMNITL